MTMRFNTSLASSWVVLLHSLLVSLSVLTYSMPISEPKFMQRVHQHHCIEGRRSFLEISASSMACLVATNHPASAIESDISFASSVLTGGNFDCLLDLPPITKGCARLYLCRHGQTENNRLHLVQGARVDPPINGRGHDQAQRLGIAVSKLISSSAHRDAVPHLAVHSKLRRARETAEVLTSTASSQSMMSTNESKLKVYGVLPSLQEIDFGSFEGKDVSSCKREMMQTFANWSIGNIDARTGGEGESGREVLERAVQALEKLACIASTSTAQSSSILAVSHSTYLRVLLSLANDSPLAESALWSIENGSVNVVDVNIEGKRRLSTGIFGGAVINRLRGNSGLRMDMPEAHLIRRNEVRHLEG
jgi:broad specificity phosphatase PhoE